MEASTISEWVTQLLEELGHEVVVANPDYAPMHVQRSRRLGAGRNAPPPARLASLEKQPGWGAWPTRR